MKEKLKPILDKIKEYDKIIIFRHFRPDGDAIGSTKGLQALLMATYPEKEIVLQNKDFSAHLAFLGGEEELYPDEYYADALGIAIDTATVKRLSNDKLSLCRERVKIDHHIPVESYGDLEWVEEHRSSACEMIAAFYDTFRDELKMTPEAAEYIFCGMVTDSGRFRFREVSGETMRLAGMLLDFGIDTERLYANLYMREFDSYKFESYARRKMKRTESGVAHLYVTKRMQKKFGLSREDASASVSYMDSIKGSLIWIAFIEGDGEIRVRLRSRFVTVSELAEKYHGGGHACAAGATVYSEAERRRLISEADELLREYKKNHQDLI
ncbi:MAG: bifunctional oligoribonuclease/PAP phosphatase NrnA [Clostridia bacterium]|nr:bifunctional oligoribonuclease/PAP phosphatase NrnA [Clostridia bacterium]